MDDRLRTERGEVGVFHPGVGAPLACGGAGAVVPDLALGQVIVPVAAVRDEGTSYHYRPAGRELTVDAALIGVARRFLEERQVTLMQYLYAGDDASGDTWDHRYWHTSSARTDLFWLAVDTVLLL